TSGYGELNTFCVVAPHRRIATGSTRLDVYEYTAARNEAVFVTEPQGCTDAVFCSEYNTILTAAKHKIQSWNAETGVPGKVFHEVEEEEVDITAVSLDIRGRRVYTGDSSGGVSVFDALTGSFLKHLSRHPCDISVIQVWRDSLNLLSASCDGLVLLQEQTLDAGSFLPSSSTTDASSASSSSTSSCTTTTGRGGSLTDCVRYRAHLGVDGVRCMAVAASLEIVACGSGMSVHLLCLRTLRKEATISPSSVS
ncbi:wd g-beta repeat-containing protein, partial [Cystoisospora suis]